METIKGAGRIGPTRYMGYRVTWPFASLSIKRESITFSMWPIRYEFPRSAVLGLVTYRIWGFRSLRIVAQGTRPGEVGSLLTHELLRGRELGKDGWLAH